MIAIEGFHGFITQSAESAAPNKCRVICRETESALQHPFGLPDPSQS
jgi:hypothetical protein